MRYVHVDRDGLARVNPLLHSDFGPLTDWRSNTPLLANLGNHLLSLGAQSVAQHLEFVLDLAKLLSSGKEKAH